MMVALSVELVGMVLGVAMLFAQRFQQSSRKFACEILAIFAENKLTYIEPSERRGANERKRHKRFI